MSAKETATNDDDRLERLAVQGPIRRNAPLIVLVALALAAGPFLSRFIESYRAVVLDRRDGEMLLLDSTERPGPPRWVTALEVEPGRVVEKSRWTWSPHEVEATAFDQKAILQFERWERTFEGVIVKIEPSPAFGSPAIAVIELTDGTSLEVPLWSDDLAGARVGRTLRKQPKSWEPDLVPPDEASRR